MLREGRGVLVGVFGLIGRGRWTGWGGGEGVVWWWLGDVEGVRQRMRRWV